MCIFVELFSVVLYFFFLVLIFTFLEREKEYVRERARERGRECKHEVGWGQRRWREWEEGLGEQKEYDKHTA